LPLAGPHRAAGLLARHGAAANSSPCRRRRVAALCTAARGAGMIQASWRRRRCHQPGWLLRPVRRRSAVVGPSAVRRCRAGHGCGRRGCDGRVAADRVWLAIPSDWFAGKARLHAMGASDMRATESRPWCGSGVSGAVVLCGAVFFTLHPSLRNLHPSTMSATAATIAALLLASTGASARLQPMDNTTAAARALLSPQALDSTNAAPSAGSGWTKGACRAAAACRACSQGLGAAPQPAAAQLLLRARDPPAAPPPRLRL